MKLSEISIRRPVLATVMSLLLVLVGLVSFGKLTLREYWRPDYRDKLELSDDEAATALDREQWIRSSKTTSSHPPIRLPLMPLPPK